MPRRMNFAARYMLPIWLSISYTEIFFMTSIFIIDDDDDDIEFLRDAIYQISPGTSCTIFLNATDAIQGLKSKKFPRPDLIFLDLNMPRVSGFQFLRELKGDPTLSEIPVVIYTTSKSYDDRLETLKMGAIYFMTKPSSFRHLCTFVTDILKQFNIHA